MAAVVNSIGFISSVLGIIGFLQTAFPGADEASGAVVRVGLGLGDSPGNNMDGTIHAVYGFDANNDYLGVSDLDTHINRGEYGDILIHQIGQETVQAKYVNVVNSGDATCLAYIAVTQPDGLQRTWYGDIGRACGQGWYCSRQVLGKVAGTNTDWKPSCTWLDSDLTSPALSAQLKVDMFQYYSDTDSVDPNQNYCSGTVWQTNTDPNGGPVARKIRKRSAAHDQMLIINRSTQDTDCQADAPQALCASETSSGPDHVSIARSTYCDMETKTLYPLCSDSVSSDCFDLNAQQLSRRAVNGATLLARSLGNARNYTIVEYWD